MAPQLKKKSPTRTFNRPSPMSERSPFSGNTALTQKSPNRTPLSVVRQPTRSVARATATTRSPSRLQQVSASGSPWAVNPSSGTALSPTGPRAAPRNRTVQDQRVGSNWIGMLEEANRDLDKLKQEESELPTAEEAAEFARAYAGSYYGGEYAELNAQRGGILSELAFNNADLDTALAGIDADYKFAVARLDEARKNGMADKEYYFRRLKLDLDNEDLKTKAIQQSQRALERQRPLLEQGKSDIEKLYQNTLASLRTKRKDAGEVKEQQLHGTQSTSISEGSYGSYNMKMAQKATRDSFDNIITELGLQEQSATIQKDADVRSIMEQMEVVRDEQVQTIIQMAQVQNTRETLILDFNNAIRKIDEAERAGQIDRNEAASRRSIASQAARNAKGRADAQATAAMQSLNAQQQTILSQESQLAATIQGATKVRPIRGKGTSKATQPVTRATIPPAAQPAWDARNQPGLSPEARSYLTNFSTPNSPFAPKLTKTYNSNNPLGIADSEWNKIRFAAQVQSGGNPQAEFLHMANYINYFGALQNAQGIQAPPPMRVNEARRN